MNYKESINIAIEAAIEALKKQIPEKPLEETKYYGIGKCPRCDAVFIDKTTNYCGNCGQALDWTTKLLNSKEAQK